MYRLARQGLLLILGSLLIPTAANGEQTPDAVGPGRPGIDELLERIERLEQDKVQMQDEIDGLKTQLADDWLTEARAAEIRAVVEDVLADADMRASLLQDGLTAGWDKHFFLASTDGRFRLNVGGMLQTRWLWNWHDAPPEYRNGFELARGQLIFSGHVFGEDVTYRIQSQYSQTTGSSAQLQDAWIRYYLTNQWAVRFGQFKLPFNREELVYSGNQQVIERSLVNESLNVGRSVGIELIWADRDNRFSFAYTNGGNQTFSGFTLVPPDNPTTTSPLALDTNWSATMRYERKVAGSWEQFRQMTSPPGDGYGLLLGIAGHFQRFDPDNPTGARDDTRWAAGTADVSFDFGGANIFSALYYHWIDAPLFNAAIWGFTAQGGVYFTEKLELYARFEYGRFIVNGSKFFSNLSLLTLGGNYYFDGQDLKFSADIGFGIDSVLQLWDNQAAGWRADPAGVKPQVVIRTQFQLLF